MSAKQPTPRSGRFKCVVIGDACVGKTCMVIRMCGRVPNLNGYEPTIVDNTEITKLFRGQQCRIEICDTAGQEDYKHLRPACYTSVDLFLLCFCRTDRNSFENLEALWLPEVKKYQSQSQLMLVGTKLDLYKQAGDSRSGFVSQQEIEGLRHRHGGLPYVECSALSCVGIDAVMDRVLTVLHGDTGASRKSEGRRRGGKCDLL